MKIPWVLLLQVGVLVLVGYAFGRRFGALDGITAAGAAWLLMPWYPRS